jgi:uncharacterized protein YfaT (DUF1175 family)
MSRAWLRGRPRPGRALVGAAMALGALALLAVPGPAVALTGEPAPEVRLSPRQSVVFRAWMVRIIEEQIRQGPTPRWFHRDCAGLVRFAVTEAARPHDARWLASNGMSARALPPETELDGRQQAWLRGWTQLDGTRGPFATARVMIHRNTRFATKDLNLAEPGDLLFFDQGDDQHLMVWMGRYVAYHPGVETPTDSGLRAVTLDHLMRWKDTRWRPDPTNPNFVGVFRLAFLSR